MSNELPFETSQIIGMDREVFLTFFGAKIDAPYRNAYSDYHIAVNRKTNKIADMQKEPLEDKYPFPKHHVLSPLKQTRQQKEQTL